MAAPFAINHETTTSLHPRPRRARDRRPYFPGLQARREAPKVLPPPDVLVRKGDVLFEVDIEWILMLSPLWVLLISLYILIDNLRRPSQAGATSPGANSWR